jgi:hypothetical protein
MLNRYLLVVLTCWHWYHERLIPSGAMWFFFPSKMRTWTISEIMSLDSQHLHDLLLVSQGLPISVLCHEIETSAAWPRVSLGWAERSKDLIAFSVQSIYIYTIKLQLHSGFYYSVLLSFQILLVLGWVAKWYLVLWSSCHFCSKAIWWIFSVFLVPFTEKGSFPLRLCSQKLLDVSNPSLECLGLYRQGTTTFEKKARNYLVSSSCHLKILRTILTTGNNSNALKLF